MAALAPAIGWLEAARGCGGCEVPTAKVAQERELVGETLSGRWNTTDFNINRRYALGEGVSQGDPGSLSRSAFSISPRT
jgi:hypothetical protein